MHGAALVGVGVEGIGVGVGVDLGHCDEDESWYEETMVVFVVEVSSRVQVQVVKVHKVCGVQRRLRPRVWAWLGGRVGIDVDASKVDDQS